MVLELPVLNSETELKLYRRSSACQALAPTIDSIHLKVGGRPTSDDVISFREMVSILVHLRDQMMRDREAFLASVTGGVSELREDFAALARLTGAAGYDIEKMADNEVRALMIQMNAHAYNAIDAMLHAVDALFDEIGGDQSIMSLLQELGIDTGELTSAHESVRKALEPRLDGFKQAEQKLEQQQAAKRTMEGKPLR